MRIANGSRVALHGLIIGATVLGLAVFGLGRRSEAKVSVEPPRLVVLVYFDQLRGDYLQRWGNLFEEDGFRRLQRDGAWFQNCHYPYAYTVTAAGHASVATGCSPEQHGIIGNEWYERSEGAPVNCVSSAARYERVPPAAPDNDSKDRKKTAGVSPERLQAPTVADALKSATGGKGKVVALSFKDRSAVLPGGRRPDACYWMDNRTGTFVTSTYYRERLHPWVQEYNDGHPADQWYGTQWNRLRPDLDYEQFSGPDDCPGEGTGVSQGRTFPHPLTGGGAPGKLKPSYYNALYMSPFGNELLLGLAKRAITAERLGLGETPDLLTLSFSCNDAIGHCWGPDSQEVLDVTLRSDLIVKELLTYLDANVGKGKYLLVLTADHGVCPLPECARAQGNLAARVPSEVLNQEAEDYLNDHFSVPKGSGRWLEAVTGPWIYLNHKMSAEHGLAQDKVEQALASWLKLQPGIEDARTRSQLLTGQHCDTLTCRVHWSFHAERSGDVMVVLKPYHLLSQPLGTGTTHGTPHRYDTHVPLLVYGPGVAAGARRDLVTPQAAAAIISEALDMTPPKNAAAPVPTGLFVGGKR